jgi:hypothetical protein
LESGPLIAPKRHDAAALFGFFGLPGFYCEPYVHCTTCGSRAWRKSQPVIPAQQIHVDTHCKIGGISCLKNIPLKTNTYELTVK